MDEITKIMQTTLGGYSLSHILSALLTLLVCLLAVRLLLKLVKKLLDVYAAHFGQRLEPLAIGGGTYARHMKNSVAFGIERPGEPGRAHMPDEYIPVNDLIEDTKTIADAIIALAGAEA